MGTNKYEENGKMNISNNKTIKKTESARTLQFETKLEYMRRQLKAKKNIGIYIINILDNVNEIEEIHKRAEVQLRASLDSYTNRIQDPEIVVISLALIEIKNYNGNFYEHVRNTYTDIYKKYSDNKIEDIIRDILGRYKRDKDNAGKDRNINVVLENTIVPETYLANFFEFIFDIYEKNFEYNLPENPDKLYEDFEFIYDGLHSVMISEGDDIQLDVTKKTYKLIKSTKSLISEESSHDSIIKLSIMVISLIDKWYWNEKIDDIGEYLRTGYKQWVLNQSVDDHKLKERGKVSDMRSRWEPNIILENNTVYLLPHAHKVNNKYDYADIYIEVLSNGKTFYKNNRPDIREIIGGYKVSVEKIEIPCPLDNIEYRVMAGREEIYSSEKSLNRKFIFFTENGKEIRNNTDYEGTAILCSKSPQDGADTTEKSENYVLSSMNVKQGEVRFINGEIFTFSSVAKPSILGELHRGCSLENTKNGKCIEVYKNIKYIMFESRGFKKYEIIINGIRHRLSEYEYREFGEGNNSEYLLDININKAGIYSIYVNGLSSKGKSEIAKFDFVYDPGLHIEEITLDDQSFKAEIKSDLCDDTISIETDAANFSERCVYIDYEGTSYCYLIPFSFRLYRLDNKQWQPISEDLWGGDIKPDSVLDIYGMDIDTIEIRSYDNGQYLDSIPLKDKGIFKQLSIGSLNSYKSHATIYMPLIGNGKAQDTAIFCYNKCVLNESIITFDAKSKVLSVMSIYHGKGKVYIEIRSNDECIFKSEYIESGKSITVDSLHSFEKYTISVYEKTGGLLLGSKRLMGEYKKTFYAFDDFPGHSFNIITAYYDRTIKKEQREVFCDLENVYIRFNKKLTDNKFMGEIYINAGKEPYYLNKINPVKIEAGSDEINNTAKIYISTAEDDGLYLDEKRRSILNSVFDEKAPDITSYIIDVKGA